MTTLANQFKAVNACAAKNSSKVETSTLKKTSSNYLYEIVELKLGIFELESSLNRVARQAGKSCKGTLTKKNYNLRLRQNGVAIQRNKLGLSANEMSLLLDVSGQSIYKWTQGKAKPHAS
jgi:DNA-binding transcriptional regulator YiaG